MEKLLLYVDGASRGNPGKSGIGVVIYDDNGVVIKQIKQYLGKVTNNVAEYMALVYGLQEGLILRAKRLVVHTDSELVAKQLAGSYRVKDNVLKMLYRQVEHLKGAFERVEIKHIPREENREADNLANQAIEMSL